MDTDPQTEKMLRLSMSDFRIVKAETAREAAQLCVSSKPDIVLLALNLPNMEGKNIISEIREWSQVPIIILSEDPADKNIVMALDMGADDYVVKPFNIDVLFARINACLRRSAIHQAEEPELQNGPLRMDLVRHKVFLDNQPLAFTPKEYNLLRYFVINRGKMLTHRQILREVWGEAHTDDLQYLRVFIGQLRDKIEDNPSHPELITTEAGIGYRMEVIDNYLMHKAS